MAGYNEILAPRLNRFLQKFLSMKGGPPAASLAGDIAFQLGMRADENDNRATLEWYRFGDFFTQAAGTGVNSAWRFRNPSGSNRIAVLEKLSVNCSVGTGPFSFDLSRGTTNADLTTVFSPLPDERWDARLKTQTNMIRSFGTNQPNLANIVAVIGVPASDTREYITSHNQEIVVLPGDAIEVSSHQVTVDLNLTHWWRERVLEPSELLST